MSPLRDDQVRPCLDGKFVPVLVVFSLMALDLGRAAAQSQPDDRADRRTESIDEIKVVGRRPVRDLRIEVQTARERVYELFNSLNGDDELNVRCFYSVRSGTRIQKRTCRPQYADYATSEAGKAFARRVQMDRTKCNQGFLATAIDGECLDAAMATGSSEAQAFLARVPGMDQRLDAEVRQLERDSPEFRRAIAGYQAAERQYAVARGADKSELRASCSITSATGGARPSNEAKRQQDSVPPKAIELAAPAPVREGLDDGALREGWVKLRYSVLADGSTADVRVVDALPSDIDPLSAVAAARTWTFDPATTDGVAADWHNNVAVIVFKREQPLHEGWPDFVDAAIEVAELISDERYEQAKSRNDAMQRELTVTLDEMAYAEMQLAAIEHALGNPQAALDAIRRATEPSVHQLAEDELKPALEHRFSLELELGLAVDALQTYDRRVELERLPKDEPMARLGAALEQSLEAPDTILAEQGRIDGAGIREHTLSWRTFSVGDVDGRTEDLNVECNRKKGVLPYEPDMEMTIPAGWGDCELLVNGEPGTRFTLYEFRQPIQQP